MKKSFLSLGLMVAAAFTLTNCTQELQNPVEPSTGVPFEVVLSATDTKTTNDGLSTVWSEGDAISLFHEYSGSGTYKKDGKFEFTGENLFKGELVEALEEESCYNWYAIYPYSSYLTSPDGTGNYIPVGSKKGASQTQKGNNSMAHIAGGNYPLAGVCSDWEYYEGEPVEIEMAHLTTLLEVVVTNKVEEELVVESVSFTGTEPIIGTYYVDLTGETPAFTSSGDSYVDNTANLVVEDAAPLANGASAKYYLAVKPFEAPAGSKLTLYVNGAAKEVTLNEAVKFEAGKIKTLNYSVEKEVTGPEVLTVQEFLAREVNSAVWYQLTGTIQNIVNTTYGNFDLVDETGSVYVYGLTATQVSSNDKSFASLGLREGDTVTLMGVRASYTNSSQVTTDQVGGPAYYVSHVAAPYVDVEASASVLSDATTYSLEVESNTDWTAIPSNGVSLDKSSGNGNATVVLTFAANTTSEPLTHTVTFTFGDSEVVFTLTQKGVVAPGEQVVVFEETFSKFNGTAGWSDTAGNGDGITPDNTGWTFANAYGAGGAAKFGTSSKKGSATTPALNFTGTATLTFKAGAWNNGSEGTNLELSMTGGTLSTTSVTLVKGAWTEYEVTITNATAGAKITIAAKNASKNRFFLDDVKITQ